MITCSDNGDRMKQLQTHEVSVNTADDQQVKTLETRVCELEEEIRELREGEGCRFSLESIASDDSKVAFYTGSLLLTTSKYVLISWVQQYLRDSRRILDHSNKGHPRSLPLIEEFFLTQSAYDWDC